MKVAFSTLGCPGWSWDEIFATAKDLGLDGIEIRGVENQMFAPEIKVFREENIPATLDRFQKAGMEIPMLTSGACLGVSWSIEDYMDEAKDYIDLAARLGTPFVRVMITPVPEPGKADIAQAKKLYLQLCEYAKGKNVCVLIETNGPLAESRVLKEFMQGVDETSGGVLWDLHHPYRYFQESPETTYANLSPWIKYLHVKDSVMENGKVSYRMMGYGDVPIFDTIRMLSQHGYEGYITLEWVKRWCPDLQEPGIVFAHFANYMTFLLNQLK